jgi:UDP-2,4-diacetamido-2,4,6-trideoxy-beta-L-altropyranose hydrolase
MTARRLLVFPDCGPRIGGGHLMRCLTLARVLLARGWAVTVVANPFAQAMLEHFGDPAMAVVPADDDRDAQVATALAWASDWLLLDHYFLSPEQEAALARGRRLMVFDDLADRPRPADVLVNPAYGAAETDYAGLLPPGARVLAGPAYAQLRPEFATHRDAALHRRHEGGHLGHALVSLGLTDVGGITRRVVQALRARFPGLVLDVVLGDAASSLPPLRERAKTDVAIRLHVDTTGMAALMTHADLAIGAGGGSAWERATLGLPAVTVILADNQRPMAQAMARDGLTLTADVTRPDFEDRLLAGVQTLIDDPALRRAISEKAAALCDGKGAERVADWLGA